MAAATTQTTSSGEQEMKHGEDDMDHRHSDRPGNHRSWMQETESEIDDSKDTVRPNYMPKCGRPIRRTIESSQCNSSAIQVPGSVNVIKNENEVRIAVTTLLETEDLSGGIGRNVSAIARDFNNSASSTRKIEDRIQSRNSFVRLLFGGDRECCTGTCNPDRLNNARIVELQQLIGNASLDTEVRATARRPGPDHPAGTGQIAATGNT